MAPLPPASAGDAGSAHCTPSPNPSCAPISCASWKVDRIPGRVSTARCAWYSELWNLSYVPFSNTFFISWMTVPYFAIAVCIRP